MSYIDELTRQSAELKGAWANSDNMLYMACAEVDKLRAENLKLRKTLAFVPGKVAMLASEKAGFGRAILPI